ncbi:hypothetical protein BD626DRAFT_563544 [Schizophyllum amplum]|uniref:Uncharacterized protein n=1 Tax=Schizophyllum amplum TaxID=97359 RepID=A0A550CYJ1_9AGAR|nr:hypothetical protein BD626DRAFT_563544 [Auriculariopsis ampla]
MVRLSDLMAARRPCFIHATCRSSRSLTSKVIALNIVPSAVCSADNVSHSTGEIVEVQGSGDDAKYTIRNDNTGKETTYQPMNIVGPA